jgi:hypothetical protein
MSVLRLLCVAALLTVVSAGCMSSHPGSVSMAYVEIEGVSMDKVVMATKTAFEGEFYVLTGATEGTLVFERDATRADRTRWASYGEALRMRVKVYVERMGQSKILVRADAYALRGSRHREDKLLRMARHPYENLLDDVKKIAMKE